MKSSLVGLEVMAVGALVLLVDGCKDGRTKAGALQLMEERERHCVLLAISHFTAPPK
jgi:hypothetical protein